MSEASTMGGKEKRPNPMRRMAEAKAATQESRYAEALEGFLWCFDHGQEVDPAFGGVQSSFLIDDILALAEVYPPAFDALVARRDERSHRLTAGTASVYDAFDFVAINRYLGQEELTLRIFGAVEPGSKYWEILGWGIREFLLEHRRDDDLLRIFNPEKELAEQVRSLDGPKFDPDGRLKSHLKDKLVRACAPLVEVLAALGHHERARQLADGILRISRTDSVVSQLISHGERAGDVQLADYLRSRRSKRKKGMKEKPNKPAAGQRRLSTPLRILRRWPGVPERDR